MIYDADFKKLLIDTFIIEKLKEGIRDELGGYKARWEEMTAVKGRLSTTSRQARERFREEMKDTAEIEFIAFLPVETDIKRTDRVRCRNMLLEILAVRKPTILNHHLEAALKTIQPEIKLALEINISEASTIAGNLRLG